MGYTSETLEISGSQWEGNVTCSSPFRWIRLRNTILALKDLCTAH